MIDLANVPLSPARRAGDLLFLSGQIALDADRKISAPDVGGQTKQVMRNIEEVLATHGAMLEDVVSATVWIADEIDFPAFNEAYRESFPTMPPARSTVVSGLMLGAKVEIAVVAYLRPGQG